MRTKLKARLWWHLSIFCAVLQMPLSAQSTFQNLDFESASFVGGGPGPYDMQWGPAMPGWTGSVAGNDSTTILYDYVDPGVAGISIFDSAYVLKPLSGNYSVNLFGVWDIAANAARDASIAQSGLVPGDALSLRFALRGMYNPFDVKLGGDTLPLVALETYPTFTVFGADIGSYAGKNLELQFTTVSQYGGSHIMLDSITFSTEPIPEPSTALLLAVAGLAVISARFASSG